jgi:hypothetical protein
MDSIVTHPALIKQIQQDEAARDEKRGNRITSRDLAAAAKVLRSLQDQVKPDQAAVLNQALGIVQGVAEDRAAERS